jgi:hypothetical protein
MFVEVAEGNGSFIYHESNKRIAKGNQWHGNRRKPEKYD